MNDPKTTKAVRIGSKLYIEQPDGTLRPTLGATDYNKLMTKTDAEIEAEAQSDPDALPLTDEQWAEAMETPRKQYIHLGVDDDVLGWFKAHGKGYQTRINAVLRRYVETRRKAG